MTKTRKITYIVLFLVVTVLLAVGGAYDLAISERLYAPDNFMAQVFESIGIFPPFVIVGATFATLFFVLDEKKKCYVLKRVGCVAGVAAAFFVFGYMAINETSLTISWLPYVVGAAFAAGFTPLTLWLISRVQDATRRKLLVFLLFASIVCVISSLILVNVLKFIWSRPRYREMIAAAELDLYSPWYHINTFSLHGHHSFPSGHTASAGALFTLCALSEVFPAYKAREKATAFIVGLYTFTMAYSRLVLGAHFLSDVTAGFAIAFITYAVTRYLYFKMVPTADVPVVEEGIATVEDETPVIEETTPVIEEETPVVEDRAPVDESALPPTEGIEAAPLPETATEDQTTEA